MPQITRFLGPVVTVQPGKAQARTRATYSIITELLEHIARYDHVEMTVDTDFVDLAAFLAAGYQVKVHPTFLLDCRQEPEDLWAGLRDKTKNVIRRAREHLTVCEVDDVNLFTNFYEQILKGKNRTLTCRSWPLLMPRPTSGSKARSSRLSIQTALCTRRYSSSGMTNTSTISFRHVTEA